MTPLLAINLLGIEFTREEVVRIGLIAGGTIVLSATLAHLARVARRRGIDGAGLLLFAALVYAPLVGFYTGLKLFGIDEKTPGSTKLWLFLVLVLGAYIGITFLDLFLFSAERERRLGWKVPRILREGARWSLFIIFTFVVGGLIWNYQIENLAVFGGALTIALSLALGPTLGSLVSGFTLTSERPFELGDWIEVEGRQGRVDQITWRSTRMVTRDNESVVFPNSLLSNIRIINLSRPDASLGVRFRVVVHYRTSPLAVHDALVAAVRGAPSVLAVIPPALRMVEFGENGAVWEVRFWIDDPRRIEDIRADVIQRVWFEFRRASIEIQSPVRNVVMRDATWFQAPPAAPEEERARLRHFIELLRGVPVFGTLPEAALERLARAAPEEVFLPGAHITEQGEAGDRMYILAAGRAAVRVRLESEGSRELATLGPGQFFGEMSLLTGSPRVATVEALETCRCICLRSRDVAPLLRETPGFAQAMAEFAAERKLALDDATRLIREARSKRDVHETSNHLLRDIMRFFHLAGPRGDGVGNGGRPGGQG